jgi:hypothetical protein
MEEERKKKVLMDYLEENVWSKAERVGKENNDRHLVQGIRLTRLRMSQLPTAEKMIRFFWSAIEGTQRSINFYDIMKQYNLVTFEDLFKDIRVKFNDEWIRS